MPTSDWDSVFHRVVVLDNSSTATSTGRISDSAIDMLAHLFPHRKRSVLELILRRCDLDLLKAIEQCRPTPSAFKPISVQVIARIAFTHYSFFYKKLREIFIHWISSPRQKAHASSTSLEPRSIASVAATVMTTTAPPSHCAPMLAAYPKWVFPMSIPFSMDPIAAHHSANSAFKCIFTNCPMCVYQIEKYWTNPGFSASIEIRGVCARITIRLKLMNTLIETHFSLLLLIHNK